MTDTNAGPVLPELPRHDSYQSPHFVYEADTVRAYGRQCWNACAEQVAGPLREALSECATAVGAGVSPDCSVDFLRQVPREVELVVAKLRERVAELERELEQQRFRADNHWETLRSIRQIAKDSGDIARIAQWVDDAGSGYTESAEATLSAVMDDRDRLRAENEAMRASLNRAESDYAGMLRGDDKRPTGTTEYTRGWGDCLRAIDAARAAREG